MTDAKLVVRVRKLEPRNDLISGALGDRPEAVTMFLPIGRVAIAVEEATN